MRERPDFSLYFKTALKPRTARPGSKRLLVRLPGKTREKLRWLRSDLSAISRKPTTAPSTPEDTR